MRDAETRFSYDLTQLKRFEKQSRLPFARRIILVLVPFVFIGLTYQAMFLVWWIGLYGCAVLVWHQFIERLPAVLNRAQFRWFLLALALYQLSFGVGFFLMFHHPSPVLHAAGYMSLFAALVVSLAYRARDTILARSDLLLLLLIVLAPPVMSAQRGAPWVETTSYALISLYYSVLYYWAQQELTAERARQEAIRAAESQQERLQALGQLTGGVAHDFNNLLTVILGNLELQKEISDPVEREILCKEVEDAARKAARLTSQLLTYSRRSTLEPELVDLVQVMKDASELAKRLLPATHRLVLGKMANLAPIRVDRAKLEATLVNLVLNARDGLPDGGDIRISVARRQIDDDRGPKDPPNLAKGSYLRIQVKDNGIGIPAHLMGKVLEPYFTTKPVGKGSGLGLPMALGFAEQSGGTLTLSSEHRQGTIVSLWFPEAEGTVMPNAIAQKAAS